MAGVVRPKHREARTCRKRVGPVELRHGMTHPAHGTAGAVAGAGPRFVRGLAPMRNRAETYFAEALSTLGIGRAASLCAHL